MARVLYGASPADYVFNPLTGLPVAGATLTVWTSRTGGSQETDLLSEVGAAISVVTTDAAGGYRFQGKDGFKGTYWVLPAGGAKRYAVLPSDLADRAAANETVASTVTGLQGDVSDLQTDVTALQALSLGAESGYSNQGNKSGAVTVDAGSRMAGTVEITLTGNVSSLTISNPPAAGGSLTLVINQDGTGGRTVAWPSSWLWTNDSVQQVESAANRDTTLELFFTPSKIRAQVSGQRFGATLLATYLANLAAEYVYDLQELSGTTAVDASPNNRPGVWSGTPLLGQAGKEPSVASDKSVTLSGDDYLAADHTQVVDVNGEWSVMALMSGAAGGNESLYCEAAGVDATINPLLLITSTPTAPNMKLRVLWRNGGGTVLLDANSSGDIYDAADRLVTVTYKAGSLKIYRGSALDSTQTITVAGVSTGAVRSTWGAQRRATPTNFFVGGLSVVAAFKKELTALQVASAAAKL